MKNIYIFLIFNLLPLIASAQTDSLPSPKADSKPEKIAGSRRELLQAFLMEDPVGVGLWMDSLARLEDENYAGLIWDERWMLYFWSASYGTLLEEASHFDENQRSIQSWKIQPQADSLYTQLDAALNDKRFEFFSNIRSAFLNEEEKAFTTLLFEYLLRLNTNEEDWAERLQAFEDHYTASRFLPFVRSVKPSILKPTNKAFGISCGLLLGNWNGKIERTLTTPVVFNVDLYYWSDRWNFLFDGAFGTLNLTRDLLVDQETWPKDDPASFFTLGLNVGYDIINAPKIRVYPSIGAAIGYLKPPTPDEEDEPLPEYYDLFEFQEFHLAAALTSDIKLFKKNYRDWNTPKGSYHGVRLKFGWNGLNLGKQNPQLQGDMFFFAIHYNFFAYIPK